MRTLWSLCYAGWLLLPALVCAQGGPPAIRVDPAITYGQWEGWGTALCWQGKIFGDRTDLADLLFTTGPVHFNGAIVPGLGLNIVRYNAGESSWNDIAGRRMATNKAIPAFRQMEGFWLDGRNSSPESPGWDWTVDANQRAMLLHARDRGVTRFELFANSPMWWMCKNGNPSGAADARDNNLAPED